MTTLYDEPPTQASPTDIVSPLRWMDRVAFVVLAFLPGIVLLGGTGLLFTVLHNASLAGASGGCGGG